MAGKGESSKDDAEEKGKGGKKKLILIIAPILVIVLAAGAWFLFFRFSGTKEEPPPEPGAVVALDTITVNLAGGHFLKVGLALQPTIDAHEVSGEKALDAAINLYSGMTIEEISSTEGRNHTKEELITEVKELYEGEVYDLYFTEFVYQ
jgi:flagellar protein FliL